MLDDVFKAIARLGDGFFGALFRTAGRWYNANRTAGNLVILLAICAVGLAIWGIKNAYLAGQAQGRQELPSAGTSPDAPGRMPPPAPGAPAATSQITLRHAIPTDSVSHITAVRAQLSSPLIGTPGAPVYVDQMFFHYGDSVAAGAEVLRLRTEICDIGVTAPHAGTLNALHVRTGDRVSDGQPLFDVNPHEAASDWR
jgi:biotin carboxyl carrier protein